MNDTYVELLIRKKHSILPVLLRNLLIVAGVLALLAAFLLTGSIVLFLAGAILLGLAYLVNFNKSSDACPESVQKKDGGRI